MISKNRVLPPIDEPLERKKAVELLAKTVWQKLLAKKAEPARILSIMNDMLECNENFPQPPSLRKKFGLAGLYYRRLVRSEFTKLEIVNFVNSIIGATLDHMKALSEDSDQNLSKD